MDDLPMPLGLEPNGMYVAAISPGILSLSASFPCYWAAFSQILYGSQFFFETLKRSTPRSLNGLLS